jgi:hypothetical protein
LRGPAIAAAEAENASALAGLSKRDAAHFVALMRRVLATQRDRDIG